MTLLEAFSSHFTSFLRDREVLILGENLTNGSRISGLGRGLEALSRARVLNVGNCELTHVGMGMGTMLDGGHLILMVKQLDFLLLGLDQMVNTLNWIRASADSRPNLGSFSIVTYICDQGFQGPQSSMVDLSGFCSLGAFPGFIFQENNQIRSTIENFLLAPGFRIFGIPQRRAGSPIPDIPPARTDVAGGWRCYGESGGITIFSCHSSFDSALRLRDILAGLGSSSCVVLLDTMPEQDPSLVFDGVTTGNKWVVMDDSKGLLKWGDRTARRLFESGIPGKSIFLERSRNDVVHADVFSWPLEEIAKSLIS